MTKATTPPAKKAPKPERPRKGGSYVRDPATGKLARDKPVKAPPGMDTTGSAKPAGNEKQEG